MSRNRYFALFIFVCIVLLCDCERFEITLDTDPKFIFGWEVNYSNKSIVLDACVETNGYVGIGISKKGKMDEADMAMGGVKSSGKTYSGVYHGKHHKPVLDKRQNWILLEASENSTFTYVKYSRLLDTGDSQNVPITDEVTHVIWAIGKTDEIKKHHGHGNYAVNLLDPFLVICDPFGGDPRPDTGDDRRTFGEAFRSYASTFLTLYNLF